MTANANDTPAPYPDAAVAGAVGRALAAVHDRPNPALDAGRSPQKYAALSADFRASAWRHLEEGDLPQASNKAWMLVAETVKAISAQHGGFIHTHRGITEVVSELARLVGNAGDTETRRRINGSFLIAGRLHSNCYENDLPAEIVRDGLAECEELSQRLYALFRAEGNAGGG